MKVLLCPIGTNGDVRPLAAFGHHLLSGGHECAFCSSTDWAHISEELCCEFHGINMDFGAQAEKNADFMGRPLAAGFRFSQNLQMVMETQEKVLHEIAGQFDVVVGSGLSFAAFSVCEHHNVPYRHIVLSPNWLPSESFPPAGIAVQYKSRWINRILWKMYSMWLNIAMRPMNRIRQNSFGMAPVTDFYKYARKDLVLSYDKSLASADFEQSDIPNIPFLHYPDRAELSPEVTEFINSGEKPVYIGFGSMPQPENSKLLGQLLRVIDELKLRAVILANRADSVVLSGNNVLITGQQPHARLFPLMQLIIHHGGAGTTFSAAKAGVPQIIMPHLLDQYYWGERIHELGIGPEAVDIRNQSHDKLRRTIHEVINNAGYKEKSLRLATVLRSQEADPCVALEILLQKAIM